VDLTLDPASQYFGMKGVFKDTIFVEPNAEVVVRSHYERYIGKFVLHCHILYHEDMGMMRMVEIHDPVRPVASSAQEGAAGGHAGHGVRH
jgi:FtsP/CotA-like multicopper oxidase with cupredoxin domain